MILPVGRDHRRRVSPDPRMWAAKMDGGMLQKWLCFTHTLERLMEDKEVTGGDLETLRDPQRWPRLYFLLYLFGKPCMCAALPL